MPSKEAIKVYLRTRPTADVADDGGMALDVARGAVTLLGKIREDFGAVVHQREERTFKFSGGILHDATQEQVYATVGAGMVSSVLQGVNATVMCYGQTGAGKTFTMTGGHGSYRHRGMVPRALADLFKRLSRETGVLASCKVSYAEIYNELVVDLLRPQTPSSDLVVTDDPERGVVVKNLTLHSVTSEEEAMRLLFEGEANRAVAEHKLNRASSRSHTVFTVSLELRRGTSVSSGGGTLTAPNEGLSSASHRLLRSKLNLVDLAGSERLDKTLSAGSVAKEAQHINKSLSFLEQVIIALGDKRREHVPYRSSKLTHVLKDSLGGNCRTALVANVWGESAHVEETAGTCEFARRMMRVEIEPNVNVVEDPATKARRLEAEVAALSRQLRHARRERVATDRGFADSDKEIDELAVDFLRLARASPDSCDPLDAFAATPEQARRALLAVRRVAQGMLDAYEREDKARAGALETTRTTRTSEPEPEPEAASMVGELEGGVADDDATRVAGIAPADARPPRDELSMDDSFLSDGDQHESVPVGEDREERLSPRGAPERRLETKTEPSGTTAESESETAAASEVSSPPDRNAAFEEYKNSEGATTSVALAENKAALRDRRVRAKRLGLQINAIKKDLDAASARREALALDRPPVPPPDVQMRSSGREEIAEVLSEEEYACMLQVKNLKREYRDLFQEMKAARSEAAYTERLIEQCKTTLVLEFESWYKREYGGSIGGLAPFLDEGGHASPGALSRGVLLDSLESVPSSPAKTLESDEKSERREETHVLGSPFRENALVRPAAARTATNAPETSAPYDSEASSAAYYSAQSSSRARGARKGETPQARRIAAQSARPFAPRKA
jgi:kinesin family protein 6/9